MPPRHHFWPLLYCFWLKFYTKFNLNMLISMQFIITPIPSDLAQDTNCIRLQQQQLTHICPNITADVHQSLSKTFRSLFYRMPGLEEEIEDRKTEKEQRRDIKEKSGGGLTLTSAFLLSRLLAAADGERENISTTRSQRHSTLEER